MSSSRFASLLPLAALVLAACPRDKKAEVPTDSAALAAAMATDTTPPADLSSLTSNIPAAAPDTFKRRVPKADGPSAASAGSIPDAPQAIMTAVERELAFQRFCYQEFGQKSDPSLAGNVAMVVTVGSGGITDATVANSRWTSKAAGQAVNRCLGEKAKLAWKVEPGAVKAGRYVVPLSFRGS